MIYHLHVDAYKKMTLVESPGGASGRAALRRYDLRTGSLELEIPMLRFAWAIDEGNRRLAYAYEKGVRVVDLAAGKAVVDLDLGAGKHYLARVSRFGRPVALGSAGSLLAAATSMSTLGIWRIDTRQKLGEIPLKELPDPATQLDLGIEAGGRIAVLSTYFRERSFIFSILHLRQVKLREAYSVKAAVFPAMKPDLAVIGFFDGQIWVYDTMTFQGRRLLSDAGSDYTLAVDPKGLRIALAGRKRCTLYDLGTMKVLFRWEDDAKGPGRQGIVERAVFIRDGSRFLLHRHRPGSKADGNKPSVFHHELVLVDSRTGRVIKTIKRVGRTSSSLSLVYGKSSLVGEDSGGWFSMDLNDGRTRPLVGRLGLELKRRNLGFYFVGGIPEILVTRDEKRFIDLWDAKTGRRILVFGMISKKDE